MLFSSRLFISRNQHMKRERKLRVEPPYLMQEDSPKKISFKFTSVIT